jgi:hypothetical protein
VLLLVASMMAARGGASVGCMGGQGQGTSQAQATKVIQVVPVEEPLHRQDPDSTG